MNVPIYRTLIPLFDELRSDRVIVRPYRESDVQDVYEAIYLLLSIQSHRHHSIGYVNE